MFNHNILHENLDVLEFSYKPGILSVCFLLNIVSFSQHLNQSVLRSEESHAFPHHALKFGSGEQVWHLAPKTAVTLICVRLSLAPFA